MNELLQQALKKTHEAMQKARKNRIDCERRQIFKDKYYKKKKIKAAENYKCRSCKKNYKYKYRPWWNISVYYFCSECYDRIEVHFLKKL